MDQGQIVERGSHAELIDKEGTYAQMWNMQKRQDDQVS
jgi:ATP-binding cassette subfamily B protein